MAEMLHVGRNYRPSFDSSVGAPDVGPDELEYLAHAFNLVAPTGRDANRLTGAPTPVAVPARMAQRSTIGLTATEYRLVLILTALSLAHHADHVVRPWGVHPGEV